VRADRVADQVLAGEGRLDLVAGGVSCGRARRIALVESDVAAGVVQAGAATDQLLAARAGDLERLVVGRVVRALGGNSTLAHARRSAGAHGPKPSTTTCSPARHPRSHPRRRSRRARRLPIGSTRIRSAGGARRPANARRQSLRRLRRLRDHRRGRNAHHQSKHRQGRHYHPTRQSAVLRRPLELGLRALVGVMDQLASRSPSADRHRADRAPVRGRAGERDRDPGRARRLPPLLLLR
jgi:hypothetical protein